MMLLPPVTLGLIIAAYLVLAGLPPSDPGTDAAVRSALPGILAVNHLALFALLVYLLRRGGEGLADVGWTLGGATLLREAALGVAFGLGLYLFKELGADPVRQLLNGETPTFTSLFAFRPAALDVPIALAATSLVFVEESIYRGYALPHLRERWGTGAAVFVTSAAFGLLHWGNGVDAVIFATVWGGLLAAIFLWRRTLVPGTVAHALYNLSVLLT